MSFQAYLDGAEKKTGKTPAELLTAAAERGFDGTTKAGVVLEWLKTDYDLGRGHGMALYHVLKNGAQISEKHVGTNGSHRDDSTTLRLDGIANR
ncbi:protein of unknown function [Lentzea albidocapillata subsp. violacea]|uniref:Valyl-tRNA synthetase n=1 Tax=Lentzea albidocapillata subsp. violacea TaxID=128104 RepID=A0A1G9ZVK1_9PSEU|nr:DUF4287 domain-containing protein [Lentzea albidocapillata]SDN24566.1 protein of unknown function [Lentzea albidocapillata subsp. violacea]